MISLSENKVGSKADKEIRIATGKAVIELSAGASIEKGESKTSDPIYGWTWLRILRLGEQLTDEEKNAS